MNPSPVVADLRRIVQHKIKVSGFAVCIQLAGAALDQSPLRGIVQSSMAQERAITVVASGKLARLCLIISEYCIGANRR